MHLKVGFSIVTDIYMIPSKLNVNIRKTAGYNNKVLISNIDMNWL